MVPKPLLNKAGYFWRGGVCEPGGGRLTRANKDRWTISRIGRPFGSFWSCSYQSSLLTDSGPAVVLQAEKGLKPKGDCDSANG